MTRRVRPPSQLDRPAESKHADVPIRLRRGFHRDVETLSRDSPDSDARAVGVNLYVDVAWVIETVRPNAVDGCRPPAGAPHPGGGPLDLHPGRGRSPR